MSHSPPPDPVTPRLSSLGGAERFAADSTTNHKELKHELLGNVLYDQPSVFARLSINGTLSLDDQSLIDACYERYQNTNMVHLNRLQQIVSGHSPLENDRETEKQTYALLVRIYA